MANQKKVTVTCLKYDEEKPEKTVSKKYEVPLNGEMSVLNVLDYIHENLDSSLFYYSCCRRGLCGECAVKVNGKRVLACETMVAGDIEIDPLIGKKRETIKDNSKGGTYGN